VLGARSRIHVDVADHARELFLREGLELGAGEHGHLLPCRQAHLAADRQRGARVVAGDHLHADAGAVTVGDGGDRLGSRRVEDPPEAQELEVHEVVDADVARTRGGPCGGEHPEPLPAQLVDGRLPERAVERHAAVGAALGEGAVEQPVRGALHEDGPRAVGGLVERRHELVRRVERHDADPARRRVGADSALHRDDLQRALGRLADERPARTVLGAHHVRVVAEIGHGEESADVAPERDRPSPGVALTADGAVGIVAEAARLVTGQRGHEAAHRHLVLRERPGLVGADGRDRSECLDRGELPRDGVPLRHLLHADRERDRDERGKPLGDGSHGEADRRRDQLAERHPVEEPPDEHHEDGHAQDDECQHLAELRQLLRERRLQRSGLADERLDAADLGRRSRRRDDAAPLPGGDDRARERHRRAVADAGILGDRARLLRRRHGLAGQRRLLDPQLEALDEAHIGGHLVAGREAHHVAGDEVGGGDRRPCAVAAGLRIGGEHAADARQRLLCSPLLQEPDDGVDDRDRHDHPEVEPVRHDRLDRGGAQQDVDQGVVEVAQEPQPRGRALGLGQQVRAHEREPARGLRARQAPGIRLQPPGDPVHRQREGSRDLEFGLVRGGDHGRRPTRRRRTCS